MTITMPKAKWLLRRRANFPVPSAKALNLSKLSPATLPFAGLLLRYAIPSDKQMPGLRNERGTVNRKIDPATFHFYQSQAPHFSLSSAISHSRHLDGFLDQLEQGARVLELGCGAGRDSTHIQARGFDLDATDGIPAMVAKANERHKIGARLMQFDELESVSEYDAVWAHACLLHCPRNELPGVLVRVCRALKPGGYHYASYKLGTGEGRDLLGRLHNFPTADWLIRTYEAALFERVDHEVFAGEANDGTQRDWLAMTVRKI